MATATTETMEFPPFNGSPPSQRSAPSPSQRSAPCTQNNRLAPSKHKPMKRKPNPNHTSVFKGSAITPCTECGKRFNSWKALFGHMRCHPDRPYRGMNMKQKPKTKPKPKSKSKLLCVQEISNWEHITDGVTRAALILMEMSGQSVEHIVDSLKRSCKEELVVGKACIDVDSPMMETEKKFAKLEIVA